MTQYVQTCLVKLEFSGSPVLQGLDLPSVLRSFSSAVGQAHMKPNQHTSKVQGRQGSALYCILWCDQALWLFLLCTCECFLAGVVFHYMVTVYSETITTICVCTFVVFNIHCCLRLQQQWDQVLVATQSSVVQRRQPSHRYRLCAKIHTSIYAV